MTYDILINLSSAVATLIAASAAYIIYKRGKLDNKKDIANIIYLEIIQAERSVSEIKKRTDKEGMEAVDSSKKVLQVDSWTKNKYLFVKDFDQSEWETLNDFYAKCHLLDEALASHSKNLPYQIELRAKNVQDTLSDYSREYVEDVLGGMEAVDADSSYKEKTEHYLRQFIEGESYIYYPRKDFLEIDPILKNFPFGITTSSISIKIKKLAKLK